MDEAVPTRCVGELNSFISAKFRAKLSSHVLGGLQFSQRFFSLGFWTMGGVLRRERSGKRLERNC